ncbi:MAG: site-specific integrase [Muribaculaceae bacterium]|nr:site-specific integrase [Muribaculaceae bacterium]
MIEKATTEISDIRSSENGDGRFMDFFSRQIKFLEECGKFGTASNYKRTWNSFSGFLRDTHLLIDALTLPVVEEYNDWLTKRGILRNSSSFYMRILRSIYNKGVRKGLWSPSNLFCSVYTGIDKTRKKAVSASIINKLINLDISGHKTLELTRNIFLFSLYARGMAFVDLAMLKKEYISGDYLCYRRQKTGQLMQIHLEPCMKSIIKKYDTSENKGDYIFPIVKGKNSEEIFKSYKSALRMYNSRLKTLSKKMGLPNFLSGYTARHTWATMARDANIPLSVISAGMGHSNESVTLVYLNSLENKVIDSANKKILSKIEKSLSL